jgi:hypothetical protein
MPPGYVRVATLLDLMQQLGVVPALGVSDDDAEGDLSYI